LIRSFRGDIEERIDNYKAENPDFDEQRKVLSYKPVHSETTHSVTPE